jgi:hypothetical protein
MAAAPGFNRHDDDPLYQRLMRLESQVGALENKVNTLTLEQQHMLALFGARFTTLEKSMELTFSEVRAINVQLSTMASEVEKSPAGRMILRRFDELDENHDDNQAEISKLRDRMNAYDGGFGLIKWIGVSGLISGLSALFWVWLRAQGVAP